MKAAQVAAIKESKLSPFASKRVIFVARGTIFIVDTGTLKGLSKFK